MSKKKQASDSQRWASDVNPALEMVPPSSVAIWPDANDARALASRNAIGTNRLAQCACAVGLMPCAGCGAVQRTDRPGIGLFIPKTHAPAMFYSCCDTCLGSGAGAREAERTWRAMFDQ